MFTCKFCRILRIGLTASYFRPRISMTKTKLFLPLLDFDKSVIINIEVYSSISTTKKYQGIEAK